MQNITSTPSFSQNVNQLKQNQTKEGGMPLGQEVSKAADEKNNLKLTELTPEALKTQFNKAILQSSMEVSFNTGNDSLALLYKTAIEGINDALKPEFGGNAIQSAADSGLDISP
jgi:hypothetical protein